MLHIKYFGYSIAYSRLLFIYTNQIRKNTLANLRINERMHAHQLTQHNCQRLGCFPFPFGRRLFPFLTTRLMNLPKGKSTGCLLVGTPTRYITRRLGKGWFTSIFLWPAQTIPLTLILFKQHFNQIVLYTKEGSTINVPTFEYQPIRPEGDFRTFTYSTYSSSFIHAEKSKASYILF